jgi:probable rRNA maturation factor
MKDIKHVMQIEFQTSRVILPTNEVQMTQWMTKALPKVGQVTVRFVGTTEGQELNYQYRKKNYSTNILTFAYAAHPLHADLVLCMPVVRREARAGSISLEAHLAHLLVHGCLHARGYDHEHPAQAAVMEAAERRILRHFGIADPYRLTD